VRRWLRGCARLVSECFDAGQPRERQSYRSRLLAEFKLWSKARRSAAHGDSIFIWIPKNAGTSVYEMLHRNGLVKLKTPRSVRLSFRNRGRVTFGHIDIASLVELGFVSPAFIENAFKFALARDPYARAVSLYRYLSATVMRNWHERPNFREFLKLLAERHYDRIGLYNDRGLSQANPQVEWLRDVWPDKIYRTENLQEFVDDISDRWGISRPDVVHVNRSTGQQGAFELARGERALIEQIYAEDFETFGYAKR
jgi:hypothetical protein